MNRDDSIAGLLIRLLAAGAAAAAIMLTGAAPGVAECDGPHPSFRQAIATAKRIVVGDVVAIHPSPYATPAFDGLSTRFTLRVRYVLRGPASSVMEIRDLISQPCAGMISARRGDRIALAFDALDYTPPIRVNAEAWIRGTPPAQDGMESITLAEVFRLTGRQAPNTSTAEEAKEAPKPSTGLAPLILAFVLGGTLGWRWAAGRARNGQAERADP